METMENLGKEILGLAETGGAPEWIARKYVAFGNHYQAAAKTAGLRYISKEILARRGLLSCLDYYLD